jgi:hypothetical protein
VTPVMGAHRRPRHLTSVQSPPVNEHPPAVSRVPHAAVYRSDPAELALVAPLHQERIKAYQALEAWIVRDPRAVALMTVSDGYPFLDVHRVDDTNRRDFTRGVRCAGRGGGDGADDATAGSDGDRCGCCGA